MDLCFKCAVQYKGQIPIVHAGDMLIQLLIKFKLNRPKYHISKWVDIGADGWRLVFVSHKKLRGNIFQTQVCKVNGRNVFKYHHVSHLFLNPTK